MVAVHDLAMGAAVRKKTVKFKGLSLNTMTDNTTTLDGFMNRANVTIYIISVTLEVANYF